MLLIIKMFYLFIILNNSVVSKIVKLHFLLKIRFRVCVRALALDVVCLHLELC